MKKPAGSVSNSAAFVTVLSISPVPEDHASLERILSRLESRLQVKSPWTICATSRLDSALPMLRKNAIPIVLSESDLLPGTWRDVLKETASLPDPPHLIVSSRLADDYLWAEALNLGAYDVLAKPFDAQEVIRVLTSAWLRWNNRNLSRRIPPVVRKAAS
ncbi:MAG TPA: hypothetical protein VGF59_04985 [Bryobacteraceae bacterium]|jgi:DNA-binding NtrC family response regulator